MINNPIVFYITTVILVLFTTTSLFARNIIYSLLSAIIVFFAAGIMFYLLGSEYNAIIQIAIYGLAVPIIIGLSIMFSGAEHKTNNKNNKHFKLPYVTIMSVGVFLLAFVYLIKISLIMIPDTFCLKYQNQLSSYGNLLAFAKGILGNYVLAFELLSLLLTISTVGFVLICSRKSEGK